MTQFARSLSPVRQPEDPGNDGAHEDMAKRARIEAYRDVALRCLCNAATISDPVVGREWALRSVSWFAEADALEEPGDPPPR